MWQFRKQYILFVVRLPTSEKRHVSYIFFAIYDKFMLNLLPKMHFFINHSMDIATYFIILSCSSQSKVFTHRHRPLLHFPTNKLSTLNTNREAGIFWARYEET